MQLVDSLINRVSSPTLTAPGPNREELDQCFKAAARAADHGRLKPYRFLIIEGEGLDRLGELFVSAGTQINEQLTDDQRSRFLSMPKRAPMIVVAIAENNDQPKVPGPEKIMCAAAATQNLINAAFTLGYGAYWRTGELASHPVVEEGLGVTDSETLIGFIYMGSPANGFREVSEKEMIYKAESWPMK